MKRPLWGMCIAASLIGVLAFAAFWQHSGSHEEPANSSRVHRTGDDLLVEAQHPERPESLASDRTSGQSTASLAPPAKTIEVSDGESKRFRFDSSLPLADQVAELLSDVLERDEFAALREHKESVVPILMQLAKDRNTNNEVRESAILLLPRLDGGKAVSMIAQLASDDPSLGVRVCSIKALGNFGRLSSERQLRSIHGNAKTEEERWLVVEAIGKVGNTKALPFLKNLEKNTSDEDTRLAASRSITQIEIENSPKKETDLVRLLYEEQDLRLKHWALNRVIRENYPSSSYYLRQAIDLHRQLPKEQRDGLVEYRLLCGIQSLGGELSLKEQEHLKEYNRLNSGPLKK